MGASPSAPNHKSTHSVARETPENGVRVGVYRSDKNRGAA